MVQKSIVSVIDQYFRRFNSKTLKVSHQPLDDLRVIVVIPIYNEEDTIEDCLDAVLSFDNQDEHNIQIYITLSGADSLTTGKWIWVTKI